MVEVESIIGAGLRIPDRVRRMIGGRVFWIPIGIRAWHPNPGDRLYYVITQLGNWGSAGYYVLKKSNGTKLFLVRKSEHYEENTLEVKHPRMVPAEVLEKAQSA